MLLEEMSARSTDKPKIKGLVKRCRSFKEDIMSRLARNRSQSTKDEGGKRGGSGRTAPSSGWTSGGTSPIPSDPDIITDPIVLIAHRLKEAYLTLHFVESLIQKNCVDLLGGSSNVMLDLMGHLLNDVKGLTALSHTSAYQSTVSQLKSALGDFLTAVDVLLLKERGDEVQKELYFEKVLATLQTTRDALARLKSLVDAKENGNHHYTNSVRHHSTSCAGSTHTHTTVQSSRPHPPPPPILTSTPKSSSSCRVDPRSPKSPEGLGSPFPQPQPHPPLPPPRNRSPGERGEKRPPLPPKLGQWTAKSFDSTDWPPSSSPASSTSNQAPPHHTSLLAAWLESSGPTTTPTSSSAHHRSLSQHGGRVGRHSTSKFDSSWTESSIYVSSSHSTGGGSSKKLHRSSNPSLVLSSHGNHGSNHGNHGSNHGNHRKTTRTHSDSYQLEDDAPSDASGSVEHLLECSGRASDSASLSLGSSLDNLLLIDSSSMASGLSPNSGGSGRPGAPNRISVSSNLSSGNHSGNGGPSGGGLTSHGLASLSNYDPELDDSDVFVEGETSQPAPSLPQKQNRAVFLLGATAEVRGQGPPAPRCPSPYENVDETELSTWHGQASSARDAFHSQQRVFMSYSESRNTLTDDERPPLPPKKKHSLIAAYVEFLHNFESYSQQGHHTHFHNHLNAIHHQHLASVGASGDEVEPPTEEPRRAAFRTERSATLANPGANLGTYSRSAYSFNSGSGGGALSEEDATSPSPGGGGGSQFQFQPLSPSSSGSSGGGGGQNGSHPPPTLPPKRTKQFLSSEPTPTPPPSCEENNGSLSPARNSHLATSPGQTVASSPSNHPSTSPQLSLEELGVVPPSSDLYIVDALPSLIPNESAHNTSGSTSSSKGGSNSDGPEIKGGDPHLLLVYACAPGLKDLRFREVFLLTYRTFVRPLDAVNLLWARYQHFMGRNASDRLSLLHTRATLDLWVDVVNSLTPKDLEPELVSLLREYIYTLVACGEIQSALKARKGLILKYSIRTKLLCPKPPPVSLAVSSETQSLLQWGATSIAQQMTLLDAELFRQLEPAELLLWAREQSEDFCPALNHFTEHFNKVSYWARSKVLLCPNSRERNRTMKKMIEVMRKLREYNNFNSLLAVLAALDSAPIRRLGFSRRLTEALKPHAALTDSSGSFRTYRQALSESKPPCIPYIGLVLQDLTFVDIGNADLLPDGKVNWVKRWQQWVVLEPGRRFHACNYGFVRNDPLLTFLNNFDESLNDDELWQLSESIKPRSKNY